MPSPRWYLHPDEESPHRTSSITLYLDRVKVQFLKVAKTIMLPSVVTEPRADVTAWIDSFNILIEIHYEMDIHELVYQ